MRRFVIAPDSFKGTLSARQAAEAIREGLSAHWPSAQFVLLPMADGGEGTLDAILAACPGERRTIAVTLADGRTAPVEYGVLSDGGSPRAVIEVARVVGFTEAPASSIWARSTVGIGELVLHCLDQGIRQFIVGLGGSSTNDGGVGMLAALGLRMVDSSGGVLAGRLDQLERMQGLDFSALDPRLGDARFSVFSDVTNPLCGPDGATATFGPQKGVKPDELSIIDSLLARFAAAADVWFAQNAAKPGLEPLSSRAGAGAAGGLGYAFQLLGGRIESGAAAVGELLGLKAACQGADWVITGEGRSDGQTLRGKVPAHVAETARGAGAKVALLSGCLAEEDRARVCAHFDWCGAVADVVGSAQLARAQPFQGLVTAAAMLGSHLCEH